MDGDRPMSRLQVLLSPRKVTWLDVAAICAAVLGAWTITSQVQQRWYGTGFSPIPYDVGYALFAFICLVTCLIGIRAIASLREQAKQLRK